MTVIEATSIAMQSPIKMIGQIEIRRANGSEWRFRFITDAESDHKLDVLDCGADDKSVPFAKLPLEDLMATDWEVGERDKEK